MDDETRLKRSFSAFDRGASGAADVPMPPFAPRGSYGATMSDCGRCMPMPPGMARAQASQPLRATAEENDGREPRHCSADELYNRYLAPELRARPARHETLGVPGAREGAARRYTMTAIAGLFVGAMVVSLSATGFGAAGGVFGGTPPPPGAAPPGDAVPSTSGGEIVYEEPVRTTATVDEETAAEPAAVAAAAALRHAQRTAPYLPRRLCRRRR